MILVAGDVPNFMKIAPIVRAIRSEDKKVRTWEDGQALRIRRDQRSKDGGREGRETKDGRQKTDVRCQTSDVKGRKDR